MYVSGANEARMRQLQLHMNTAGGGRRKGGGAGRWQLPATAPPAAAAAAAAAAQRKTWQREAVLLACGGGEGGGVVTAHRPGSSRWMAFEWDGATVDCRCVACQFRSRKNFCRDDRAGRDQYHIPWFGNLNGR